MGRSLHLVTECTVLAAVLMEIPARPVSSLHSQSVDPFNEVRNTQLTVYRYSRTDLLRILRLTARALASWEKAKKVAAAESYSFFDLLQIKKVHNLCAKKVRPAVIRQSLQAMQKSE